MIHFKNVSKTYPNGYCALNNINLNLERGEMAFLTGHSGAGKTSLLKLIPRIETPTKGDIFLNSHKITNLNQAKTSYIRRAIGIIFQDNLLLNDKTAFENVALPLLIAKTNKKQITSLVSGALEKVGLLRAKNYYPKQLSAGEIQRISIARAIVNKPLILLADEPTGNLDPKLSKEIFKLFEMLNKMDASIIIATHDLNLIKDSKYRCLVLDKGHLSDDIDAKKS